MKLREFKEDLGQGASLDMVLIPAGKFLMGSHQNLVVMIMKRSMRLDLQSHITEESMK